MLYGDIYNDSDQIVLTYTVEIRRLAGNPRSDIVTDNDITTARASASERVERLSRRENVNHTVDRELYNLMSEATNYFASAKIMTPFNDKQETRKLNIIEGEKICKEIQENETPTDTVVDITDPIVTSDYATSGLASDHIGEGLFISTKYGNSGY